MPADPPHVGAAADGQPAGPGAGPSGAVHRRSTGHDVGRRATAPRRASRRRSAARGRAPRPTAALRRRRPPRSGGPARCGR
ncbi:hypothetical protein SLI_5572 [Streptomyces lividans 1326]|uniref:Uncharacterized protein n=1 Tax=Streptomyces lividans 1326 TaxID=1200984 RepID=A0A7U9DW44_STRLI|nr:hypothetical protein SLI_5572 [Streptomyces lividans 1326]